MAGINTPRSDAAPHLVDMAPAGAPTAPPILMLHGWTGSKEDFEPLNEPLATRRRVLVPDLPGHGGQAEPADADYGPGTHVRWLLALLDDRGVGDFHLLGHAHGGLLAQRLAYLAAERVTSLTLIGTGPGAPADATCDLITKVAITVRDDGHEAAWELLRATHAHPSRRVTAATESGDATGEPDGISLTILDSVIRDRFMAMPTEAIIGVARNLIAAAPLGAFLYGIDFAALICHGEDDDAWLPHQQRMLADRIPKARYEVIAGAGHSPAVENPSALLALLQPFLHGADPSTRHTDHSSAETESS